LDFPLQLNTGTDLADMTDLSSIVKDRIRNVVLLGMGGSAIGGDLNRSYLIDRLKVPFMINRSYDLPEYVDSHSLVLVSSYSGNTEETLSGFVQAIERKAQVISISSSGKVEELSKRYDFPLVTIPSGLPPRASLGLSFSAILKIFSKLNMIDNHDGIIKESMRLLSANLEKYRMENTTDNPAKQIARKLHKKLPIIYTEDRYWDAVGLRLKGQICENAKTLAYTSALPEMNHNELVGWDMIDEYKDFLVAVFIMDESIHPKVRYRMEFVIDHIRKLGVETVIIKPESKELLAKILEIIQLSDFISYYMAILNNIDPEPIAIINDLKNRLSQFETKVGIN